MMSTQISGPLPKDNIFAPLFDSIMQFISDSQKAALECTDACERSHGGLDWVVCSCGTRTVSDCDRCRETFTVICHGCGKIHDTHDFDCEGGVIEFRVKEGTYHG